MTSGPTFKTHFKRKRLLKTDYKQRLALLKAKIPRFVVRLSNNMVRTQIVDYNIDGDKTIISATSNELKALGWKHGLKSTPAIYLTSLLLCSKAKSKKIDKVIFDLGVRNYKAQCKIFAALKAVVDSGLDCPYNEKAFPKEDRINGKVIDSYMKNNISKDFEVIKEKILNK